MSRSLHLSGDSISRDCVLPIFNMSNLSNLRKEAQASMQAMVDRALVQDTVSTYKRELMFRSKVLVMGGIILPWAIVFVRSILKDHGSIHKDHTLGVMSFFLRYNKTMREIYAPEVYNQERKHRPYEINQFGIISS